MHVRSLGYLGFESAKLGQWRNFCTEFLGLMDVSDGDNGEQRYRMDNQAWRFAIQPGTKEDLAFVGFEVHDEAVLAAICDQLRTLDYDVQTDANLAKLRNVSTLCRAVDPDGLQVELYCGATDRSEVNFVSPAGVSGFVSADEGLGHIVLFTRDEAAKKRFYMDGLGFRLSDTIAMGPITLTFMHCNPRHHTLALAEANVNKHIQHFMLQTRELNDVGYANDRALASNIPITSTLGKHTNDQMLSFYARTPSGFDVEYGYGGRTIDDNWTVSHYTATSIWGHKREQLPSELVNGTGNSVGGN